MSNSLEFGCLPTAVGSMPHTNPAMACAMVMKYLPDLPVWPQLPKRSDKENMIAQFSEGFPGIVMEGANIHVEPTANFESELEQLYIDCQQENAARYGISAEYAAGLHAFLSQAAGSKIVKGQVTGPITWGVAVRHRHGLGILYDDSLAEAAAKLLRLKASWQESILRQVAEDSVIFLDEPYLVSLGSVFTPIPEERVPVLLEEVLRGIRGTKGLHCCGNTSWSVLLDIGIDVLSFDAYTYASSLSTHSDKVKSFLQRGGNIAWGIVPNDEGALAKESLASLRDRLEEAMAPFTRDGVTFKQMVARGLITPSCGLQGLSPEGAEQALELTAKLSRNLRDRYLT